MQPCHPVPQDGIAQHLLLGHISGQSLAAGVGQQDIKITSVVCNKQHRFVGYVLFADHRDGNARNRQNLFKCPLYDAQTLIIRFFFIKLPDDPFDSQNGDTEKKEQKKK